MQLTPRARAVAAASLALLCSSCSSILQGDCVTVGVFGVNVNVTDKRTGLVPDAVTVSLADSAYQETMQSITPGTGRFFGAIERVGTYTVTATAPGYVTWTRSNVQVTRGGHCDAIRPVTLNAPLEVGS